MGGLTTARPPTQSEKRARPIGCISNNFRLGLSGARLFWRGRIADELSITSLEGPGRAPKFNNRPLQALTRSSLPPKEATA